MDSTITVAIISFLGTVIGTIGGIITSSKLTAYRLEQLERKMDAQSHIAAKVPLIEEKIKTMNRRISRLEHENAVDYSSVN